VGLLLSGIVRVVSSALGFGEGNTSNGELLSTWPRQRISVPGPAPRPANTGLGPAKCMQQIPATFRQNSTQVHCTKIPKEYLYGRRITVKIDFMFCWPCISIHRVMKTILIHNLSTVYFVNQPLHVSGIFVALYQEIYIRTTIGMCCAF